jgi:hypothetical protein
MKHPRDARRAIPKVDLHLPLLDLLRVDDVDRRQGCRGALRAARCGHDKRIEHRGWRLLRLCRGNTRRNGGQHSQDRARWSRSLHRVRRALARTSRRGLRRIADRSRRRVSDERRRPPVGSSGVRATVKCANVRRVPKRGRRAETIVALSRCTLPTPLVCGAHVRGCRRCHVAGRGANRRRADDVELTPQRISEHVWFFQGATGVRARPTRASCRTRASS